MFELQKSFLLYLPDQLSPCLLVVRSYYHLSPNSAHSCCHSSASFTSISCRTTSSSCATSTTSSSSATATRGSFRCRRFSHRTTTWSSSRHLYFQLSIYALDISLNE